MTVGDGDDIIFMINRLSVDDDCRLLFNLFKFRNFENTFVKNDN